MLTIGSIIHPSVLRFATQKLGYRRSLHNPARMHCLLRTVERNLGTVVNVLVLEVVDDVGVNVIVYILNY